MRSYEAARSLFSFLAFCAWSVVAIGGVIALIGVTSMSSYAGGAAGLLAMVPGIGIVLAGLLLVAFVQIGRANVDTAEYTQQMLKISRDQLDVSKQSLKQGDTFQKSYANLNAEATNTPKDEGYANATLEANKAAKSKPEAVKQIEQKIAYRGYSILAKDDKFRVNKAVFEKIEFAKEHIDQHRINGKMNAKVAAIPTIKTPPVQMEREPEPNSTAYKGRNIEAKGDKYVCNGIPFKTIDAAKNYIDNFAT